MEKIMNIPYKNEVLKYHKNDALTAIIFWIALVLVYAAAGLFGGLYASISSIILPLACIVIVLIKKQGLSSIGLGKEAFIPSIKAGFIFGISYIVIAGILPGILLQWELETLKNIVLQFLYYIVIIAFSEEVIFRGYIQTRLYGILKQDFFAITICALLFSLMHVPYQLISGNRVFDLWFIIWLAFTFIMHIIFNVFYVKYNSIYGPILFHALWNMRGEVFIINNPPDWYNNLALIIAGSILVVLGIKMQYSKRRERI
jgi:membrane protease YdiL (CAAX protease family)